MSAKDYHLVVGNFGNMFISKVSKRRKGVMLDDRIQIPDGHVYQLIHQFAEAAIKEGCNALEIKNQDGSCYLTLTIYNEETELRRKAHQAQAKFVLNYLEHPFINPAEHIEMLQESLKSMANLLLKILD